jgi:hypothetical protein
VISVQAVPATEPATSNSTASTDHVALAVAMLSRGGHAACIGSRYLTPNVRPSDYGILTTTPPAGCTRVYAGPPTRCNRTTSLPLAIISKLEADSVRTSRPPVCTPCRPRAVAVLRAPGPARDANLPSCRSRHEGPLSRLALARAAPARAPARGHTAPGPLLRADLTSEASPQERSPPALYATVVREP